MGLLALGGSDCEALRDGWLGQPVNAVSSLAYVAAGTYVLRRGGPTGPAVALVAVGVGSVLYHGPMPPGAELVHDGSIVALLVALPFAGRPPAAALLGLAAALVVNGLTRSDAPLCRPYSLLQGHAAWHVLTAVALAVWLTARRARWRWPRGRGRGSRRRGGGPGRRLPGARPASRHHRSVSPAQPIVPP